MMGRFADCLAVEMGTPPTVGTAAPAPAPAAGPRNPAAKPPPGPAGDSAEAAARRPSEEVLDLGEASREAVLKRVVPVAAGLGVLLLLLWRRRR
jgi:hypothetical protein